MAELILPGIGEHAAIVGMTGSGKSVLARRVIAPRHYVVVFDAKGLWNPNPEFSGEPSYRRFTNLSEVMKAKDPKLLYAPAFDELANPDIVESFFEWVYKRGHCTVYVDEVYSIVNRDTIPYFYAACLTRGRELGITVISATQRPKRIPMVIMSESTHFYVFRLMLPQDRKTISEILPINPDDIGDLPKHEFYYGNLSGDILGPCRLRL